jgi:hypothetical protein
MDWSWVDPVGGWLATAAAAVWAFMTGPWMKAFWDFMNSNFVSGLIPAIVGVLLARRVAEVAETNKAAEVARSAEAQIQSLDRQADAAPAAPPSPADPTVARKVERGVTTLDEVLADIHVAMDAARAEPPPDVRFSIASAEDRIGGYKSGELLSQADIDELDAKIDYIKDRIDTLIKGLDGRRRRKYQNVARYDYRPLVLMLASDGSLNAADAQELVDLLTIWRSHLVKKAKLPHDVATRILNFTFAGSRTKRRQVAARQARADRSEGVTPPENGPGHETVTPGDTTASAAPAG